MRTRLFALLRSLFFAAVRAACVWEFAWTGLGTPAPIDPPRGLVVKGRYRWVRNPMYPAYCANVRRWIPRLTPFDNDSAAAVPSANLD